MNSFSFTDIDKNAGVTLDAPLYYLRINETYDTPHYAAKAKARLLKMMENIRKNYPTVSFMIGISNVDGDTANKQHVRTGRRGRPAVVVSGIPKREHVHIVVYGKGASAFCKIVRDKLNRKHACQYAFCQCISNRWVRAIGYVYMQSYSISIRGEFDFKDYSYMFKWERNT